MYLDGGMSLAAAPRAAFGGDSHDDSRRSGAQQPEGDDVQTVKLPAAVRPQACVAHPRRICDCLS